jgi:hypothetical protein
MVNTSGGGLVGGGGESLCKLIEMRFVMHRPKVRHFDIEEDGRSRLVDQVADT